LSFFAWGALLMRAKRKASESRVITCVLSSYFFLKVIVCECLRGDKQSATAKTSRWNIPFLLCVGCFVDPRKEKVGDSRVNTCVLQPYLFNGSNVLHLMRNVNPFNPPSFSSIIPYV
ncbi:MAG: hypothetical protein PWP37_870, partial [Thermotogota bacterium]|nr:hypothetical protein [Thermotogota bacterium]MDK2864678.1 hypothetical protein [Thermotogota bacterium]